MDDTPIYKRKWFFIAFWMAVLIVGYLVIVSFIDDFWASPANIIVDLIIVIVLQFLWLAFFAQFVLPVHTFRDRQKIFDRLLSYLSGGHGPAIFIENGKKREKPGESDKKGPGVLWLDSASAAVTRTATAIKQTMGPGVHFTDSKEVIAGTIDLHNQSQTLGKESDQPFAEKKDDQSEDEYKQIQDRRKQVAALTRDGIEIVPTINVTFRVDTGFPKEGQPGSRYGYRMGVRKQDKVDEEKDREAIRRAILGEGINPNERPGSPRHRVAWNQLPALLAVDLWREYAAKFTLDELFKPDQEVPPTPPSLPPPPEEEFDPFSQPVSTDAGRESMQSILTGMLRFINVRMNRLIQWLNGKKGTRTQQQAPPASGGGGVLTPANNAPQKKTALQVINDMVKARLTQPSVAVLDDHGTRIDDNPPSNEFKLLQERGIKVISVGISNLRVDPSIDREIIGNWEASWLSNAKAEKEQIERRRTILETAGEDQAARNYAAFLGRGLIKEKPMDIRSSLKSLLMRSRLLIVKNDQLRRLLNTERQEIEEILQWVENND